jgi:hypothetical protein
MHTIRVRNMMKHGNQDGNAQTLCVSIIIMFIYSEYAQHV